MRLTVLAGLAFLSIGLPAGATVEAWMRISYPLADLQFENANCVAETIAQDSISNGPESFARVIALVLSNQINVPNPLAVNPEQMDANAITDGAKGKITARFEIDIAAAEGKLLVDASELVKASGESADSRASSVRRVKQLVTFALGNLFRGYPKARIALSIEGLPRQDDLKGVKLPAAARSPFTAASPLLKALQAELRPTRNCPR
jgi:hypothetical protein